MADLKKPVAPKRSRFGNIFAFGIILIFVIAVVYLLTSDSEEIQVYKDASVTINELLSKLRLENVQLTIFTRVPQTTSHAAVR